MSKNTSFFFEVEEEKNVGERLVFCGRQLEIFEISATMNTPN